MDACTRAEGLLEALLDSSDAIIGERLDRTVICWNRAAERLFGYRADEMVGRSLASLTPGIRREVDELAVARAARGERAEPELASYVAKEGRIVEVSRTLSPLCAADGTVLGVVTIARFLDPSTAAAYEALRLAAVAQSPDDAMHAGSMAGASAAMREIGMLKRIERDAVRLAAIVQSSDDAIVSKDLDGIILTWNNGAERLFGYTAAEAIGRSITIIIPPERYDEEVFVSTRIRSGLSVDHFETVRRRKDGEAVDISLSVSPIRMPDGAIIGASKIARDITEQKRAANRLREEIRIVETLNRVGATVASSLEREQVVQAVIDAATDLLLATAGAFGYDVEEVPGTPRTVQRWSGARWETFVRLVDTRAFEFSRTLPGGEGVVRLDDVSRDEFGDPDDDDVLMPSERPVRGYLAVPVVARSGEVLGRMRFGHLAPGAFTERHQRLALGIAGWAAVALENARLYTQAQLANRIKDDFLATLSHELRTPVNAVMGWCQILQSTTMDDASRRRALDTIQRNARLQAQLIEDLLDVSRIVAGKFTLRLEIVDLAVVIAAAIEDVRPGAEAKRIELRTTLETEAALIVGDPARLQQVVWNLLSNAVKFTADGGRVDVRLHQADGVAEIAVEDTGQGIAPAFIEHIFDRFRQADPSTTRRHGGLGLGLGIAKHLVEAHGGTIVASSPGVGQGAAFVVRFPISTATSPPVRQWRDASEVTVASRSRLTGVRILVVDDDPDAAEVLAFILKRCGALVTMTTSSREALRIMAETPFDILLSDIGMPDLDGYDLIRAVRASDVQTQERAMPAVAVTAYSGQRAAALAAGFNWQLEKPIDAAEVIDLVAHAVGRS